MMSTRLGHATIYSLSLVLLVGCSKQLDFRNAEISNNKIYESGANIAFSGKLTGLPLNKMPVIKIQALTNLVSTVSKDKMLATALMSNSLTAVSGNDFGKIICDTTTSDGLLDGEAICRVVQGPEPIFKFNFNKNVLDGTIVIYDVKHKNQKVAEATYKNGELEGESKIYSSSTGKLIHSVAWENGKPAGLEEQFDESTGKVIFSGTIKNGVYDGVSTKYKADGELIGKTKWIDGKPEAANSTQSANVANVDACVDQWTAKYRKESAPDAMINQEQMDEWAAWCQGGKTP